MAGLLSDEEEGTAMKPLRTESKTALEESPAPVRDQGRGGGLVKSSGTDAVGGRLAELGVKNQRPRQAGTTEIIRAERGFVRPGVGGRSNCCADQTRAKSPAPRRGSPAERRPLNPRRYHS